MKCGCNCHDPKWRKLGLYDAQVKKEYEEHDDCALCFQALMEEQFELLEIGIGVLNENDRKELIGVIE